MTTVKPLPDRRAVLPEWMEQPQPQPPTAVNTARLHGREDDADDAEILREKPWHRAAAYHFASGMSAKEVARANGKGLAAVTRLLAQGWFQEVLTGIMQSSGGKDVMDLFRAETVNSFIKLVELRDDPQTPKSVRLAAIREILDRGHGKPTQYVKDESTRPTFDDPCAEVAHLEKKLSGEGSFGASLPLVAAGANGDLTAPA